MEIISNKFNYNNQYEIVELDVDLQDIKSINRYSIGLALILASVSILLYTIYTSHHKPAVVEIFKRKDASI